jgi:sulfur-oxidizing protein SoxY
MRLKIAWAGMILMAAPAVAASDAVLPNGALADDPLQSPFLPTVLQLVLPEGAKVRFDDRVKVSFPAIAENQRQFPVQVDARAVPGVQRIIVFADLNPIQRAVTFTPVAAEPFIALRMKLDQRTPVRAAVQLADGSWLLAGGWIDAAGGGCSAPPASRVKGDWAQYLMAMQARLWRRPDGARLAISVRHPMDTGFVDNIPSYWLETLTVSAGGQTIGAVELQASVAEDPAIMLMPRVAADAVITLDARDTGGLETRVAVAGHDIGPAVRLAASAGPAVDKTPP